MSSTLPDGAPAQAPGAWPAAGLLDPAALAPALLDAMAEAVLVVDHDSRIVGANPSAGVLAGQPPAALLGRPLWDAFPRAPDDPWRVAHARVADGGGSATIEVRVGAPDRWYEVRTVAIAAGVALFWTDVTARHHTSERFVALEVATGQAVWITDADGAVREVLPSWLAFTGQTLDASLGWGWLAAMHPDDRPATQAAFARALQGLGDYAHVTRIRRHDGAWRRLLVRAVPVRDGTGAVREWIGVNLDVTDEHVTRDALRISEERLRYAMDGGEEGLWDWDVATGAVYFSPSWYRLLGYATDEVAPTLDGWRALVHPDDLADVLALMSEHLDGRIPVYQTEHRMRRRDGTWAWIQGRGKVVAFDAASRPQRVVGLQTDVSARKLSEAMLLERTRQLELGMRAAGMVSWSWDLATDAVTLAGSLAALHDGLDLSITSLDHFLSAVHVDDRAAVRAALDDAVAGRVDYEIRFRLVTTDGSVRWMADIGDVLRDASGTPVAMIGMVRDITEEREREQAVRASEARLQLALAAARMGTWEWDAARDATSTSETLGPLVGQPAGWTPTPDAFLAQVHPEDRARVAATMFHVAASSGRPSVAEFRVELPDGTLRHLVAHAVAQDAGGRARVVGALADATERVRLEDQLRQAQKMEAVGQLAGGIAHDFNNLLTVIGGNLGFVRADLPSDHAAQADLAEIARAADRARALVRQLLAFSRKQVLTPRALDLNEVVRGAEKLLRRVIGEEIVLETALAPDVGIVCADAGQLDQVLLNLAVNARDAMLTAAHGHPGTGGTLTLETRTIRLDARAAVAWPPLVPGRYVCLVVRDSGHGMDPATRAHAFEPFFTTKPVGVGTGLGLATVYGIVAQSGGAVRLESTLGQGSTITILLPEVEAMDAAADTTTSGTVAARQQGLVLLVEDEAAVRATARRILERHGYAVLEARHGADALLLWRAHRADVRAVVTDLRMPEMGGPELASVLRGERPDLPLVLVTGYADQPLVSRLGPRAAYVEKPFTGDALLAALRQVLAAEG